MYIESEKVKFYPSAYRQYQDGGETKNINPESELNTEYNITSHIAKLLKKNKGSFVVDYVENNDLEFYLGGYYIHITSPQDILNAFPNATKIWANMKVVPFTPTDNTEGFSELYEVVDYEDNGKNIDKLSDTTKSFRGVAFLDTEDNTATFSLCLFTRSDIESSWHILESSNYILGTSEIYNESSPYNIAEEFDSLRVYTDDLHAQQGSIGYATINSELDVKGDALFENQVEFEGDLVPTSGSQIDIGQSGNKIANIYVNKIIGVAEVDNGQNNITLKSSIIPSGNVDLGSTTTKLANIYANNITSTTLVTTTETVSNITISHDLLPTLDASSHIGSETNRFIGYFESLTSEGIETLGLKVNDITTTASNITLYKSVLPSSTNTVSFGNSNLKFSGIYATNFYGALTGNASTATKLNGTNVGNTSASTYFSNGVPVVSNHYHYMLTNPNSFGTITVPYDSSNPTQTPVSVVGSTVYLKAGRYSFSFQDSVVGILGSGTDGTVVDVIIPTNLSLGSMQSTTTKYTQASFLGMVPYNEGRGRQEYWYSRLRALHTPGSSNVILAIQLGIGYLNSDESLTLYGWSDVLATISMVVDYFN